MALEISHDECVLCGQCLEACPYEALERIQDKIVVREWCTLCGACLEVCPPGALAIKVEEDRGPAVDLEAYRGVWILAEHHDRMLHRVVPELIGAGRRLADERDSALEVVVPGADISPLPEQLAGYPVDRVRLLEHERLAEPLAEPTAKALSAVMRERKPEIVLAGATSFGRCVIPRVATLLHTGLTADCTGLEIDAETGNLLQTRPAFGGNVMATIACPDHRPQMATVRPGVMTPCEASGSEIPPVARHTVDLSGRDVTSKLVRVIQGTDETVNIADADVLVAGGRGVGGPKGFDILRELAAELGGQVAGSRVAVDAGWIPYAHQVGQTGKTVQPSLYIACGISGSLQHRVGMQSSDVIVAVNTDPDAPIFKLADYGIVGDLHRVLRELKHAISEIRDKVDATEQRTTSTPSRAD